MRTIGIDLLSFVILIAMGSCASVPSLTSSGPRTIVVNGDEVTEIDGGGFTTWYCKDYINGGPTLVEVGFFGTSIMEGFGFVLYDGGYNGESTLYHRTGLEHRWDWGKEGEFSFVIKTDGTGAYYDFSTVPSGEPTKPSEIYKCYKRK
ncbi:MAG: hypothetical protein RQ761_11665 [Bacteroidales bacterium]|nr:hypothetical protein [Bacteroidales bacterium]